MKISKGKISTVIYCDCGRQHGSIHGKDDRKEIVCACRRKYENLGPNGWALKYPDNPCPWKFKSPECGYTGGASSDCGKSFEDCQALEHEECFGGFPGMPETPPYKKPMLEIKINTTKFEKALKKASKAVKEFKEEVERATWSPKVGEWVWAKGNTSSAEKPRKITETNHLGYKGCYASEDADGGVGNIDAHLGDMIRPLRLEEVSSVEMARQFFRRDAICIAEGPHNGKKAIIDCWDDTTPEHNGILHPWGVVMFGLPKLIWCQSKNLKLLTDSTYLYVADTGNERITPLRRSKDGLLGVASPKRKVWGYVDRDNLRGSMKLNWEHRVPIADMKEMAVVGRGTPREEVVSLSTVGELGAHLNHPLRFPHSAAQTDAVEELLQEDSFGESLMRLRVPKIPKEHQSARWKEIMRDYMGGTGITLEEGQEAPSIEEIYKAMGISLIIGEEETYKPVPEKVIKPVVELFGITKPARKVVEKLKAQEKREIAMRREPQDHWFKCAYPTDKPPYSPCGKVFKATLLEIGRELPRCPRCKRTVDESEIIPKPISRLRKAAGWMKKKARACVARPAGLAYRAGALPFRFWFAGEEEIGRIDSIEFNGENDPYIETGTGPIAVSPAMNFKVGDEFVLSIDQPCRAKRLACWLSRKALYLPWKAWRAGRWTALSGASLASALVPVGFAKWAAWEICKLWALLLLIGAVAGAAVFATIYALRIAGAL